LRRGVEGRRLREHFGLELAQGTVGVDAELVGQRLAGPPQRAQRIGLAVRAIERERQQPPAFLTQRVAGDEVLQLRHEGGALASVQPRGELLLVRMHAQPLEADRLGLDPRLAGEVGVGRPAPQLECPGQQPGPHRRVGQRRRVLQQPFELPRVHCVGVHPQHVARSVPGDQSFAGAGVTVGLEPFAQVAEVGVQGAGPVARLRFSPQGLDQSIGRQHIAAGQHKEGEHRASLEPAKVDGHAVAGRGNLAEDADRKRPVGLHGCRPSPVPVPRAPRAACSAVSIWP
jgi:hypothetical protein